jgi:hypothetical protein
MQMADVLTQGRVSVIARELLCQGQEKQSVSQVEVTCPFAVAEPELVLKLEAVVVAVRPIAGKVSLIRDLPTVPRFTITNLTARVERSWYLISRPRRYTQPRGRERDYPVDQNSS